MDLALDPVFNTPGEGILNDRADLPLRDFLVPDHRRDVLEVLELGDDRLADAVVLGNNLAAAVELAHLALPQQHAQLEEVAVAPAALLVDGVEQARHLGAAKVLIAG